MCQRIGRPPTSTRGLGRNSVSSRRRVPKPPANITTCIFRHLSNGTQSLIIQNRYIAQTKSNLYIESGRNPVSTKSLRFDSEISIKKRGFSGKREQVLTAIFFIQNSSHFLHPRFDHHPHHIGHLILRLPP